MIPYKNKPENKLFILKNSKFYNPRNSEFIFEKFITEITSLKSVILKCT